MQTVEKKLKDLNGRIETLIDSSESLLDETSLEDLKDGDHEEAFKQDEFYTERIEAQLMFEVLMEEVKKSRNWEFSGDSWQQFKHKELNIQLKLGTTSFEHGYVVVPKHIHLKDREKRELGKSLKTLKGDLLTFQRSDLFNELDQHQNQEEE